MKIRILVLLVATSIIIAIFSCGNSVAPQQEIPSYLLTIPTCFAGSDKALDIMPQIRADTSTDQSINVFFNLTKMYLAHMEGTIERANYIIYAIENAKTIKI